MHPDTDELRRRYQLAAFGEAGGILFDGDSGAVHRVNRTATELIGALLRGDEVAQAAAELAAKTGAAHAQVMADAQRLAAQLAAAPVAECVDASASSRPVQLTFDEASGRVTLLVHARPRLHWWPAAHTVARAATAPASPAQLEVALRQLVPHIAAAHGHVLVHASALAWQRGGSSSSTAIAWLGASGAGKSSVAEQAVAAGLGTQLADDIVWLAADAPPRLVADGEARLRQWCAVVADTLADAPVDADTQPLPPLPAPLPGDVELGTLAVLAAEQRHDAPTIRRQPLPVDEALLAILPHTFAELGTPEVRHTAFQTAATLAQAVTAEHWHVPNNLAALHDALARL